MLHLTGYDLNIEDLKQFRQYGSKTPGHPENILTEGVEATTGPLGQGFSNGVGMAIASKKINTLNKDLGNHKIYSIVSDGDLMEGITSEAASLAGTLKLNNIIYIYDSNKISIEGSTDKAFTENVKKRFESYDWNVIEIEDSEDCEKISSSISAAKNSNLPSLLILKSKIGYGSPNKFDSEKAHGEALGEEEVKLTREKLGWDYEPFNIPNEILNYLEEVDPENREVYLQKATIYSKNNHSEEAIAILKRALQFIDDKLDIWNMIAMEFLLIEDFQSAIPFFKKCLEYDNEDYQSLYNLIFCGDCLFFLYICYYE